MELSKETKERIKRDADAWRNGRRGYRCADYAAGATAEAERAQGLIEVAKAVIHYAGGCDKDDAWVGISWDVVEKARKALNQYNQP